MQLKRRSVLKMGLSSLAYFSTQSTTPNWIIRSANALAPTCLDNGRILVILQQSGGNDGLNMVIPRTDPIYYDANTRPTIRVPSGSEINLDGLNGFHPRLSRLANWYQQGNVGIIHNVGYVNPNLSHFSSTDYYELGYAPGDPTPNQGWISRFYDNSCSGVGSPDALFMAGSGISTVPKSMFGSTNYTPPAIYDPSTYAIVASSDAALRLPAITALNAIPTADPTIDYLQRSENIAEASIADIATAVTISASPNYPTDSLGNGLKLVSQIIRAGFQTRIFYVSQGGYDTHANQIQPGDPLNAGDHPQLLDSLDRSLDAFLTEMNGAGLLNRVMIVSFSEFGRRVKENNSYGTDHGAANTSFVIGGCVQGGVYGGQPDLATLINGNLNHTVDFRSIYAKVIEGWFGSQAAPVFGQSVYDTIISGDLPAIPFISCALPAGNAVPASNWTLYN